VPGRAEAAFAVSDTYQGHGIGTKLLERLGIIARTRGINAFEAYLLDDNQKMRDVFADAGFGIGYAYVTSQMGTRLTGDPRDVALRDALYSALQVS
jgi:GNAT superfamily N-acetyltransferase